MLAGNPPARCLFSSLRDSWAYWLKVVEHMDSGRWPGLGLNSDSAWLAMAPGWITELLLASPSSSVKWEHIVRGLNEMIHVECLVESALWKMINKYYWGWCWESLRLFPAPQSKLWWGSLWFPFWHSLVPLKFSPFRVVGPSWGAIWGILSCYGTAGAWQWEMGCRSGWWFLFPSEFPGVEETKLLLMIHCWSWL